MKYYPCHHLDCPMFNYSNGPYMQTQPQPYYSRYPLNNTFGSFSSSKQYSQTQTYQPRTTYQTYYDNQYMNSPRYAPQNSYRNLNYSQGNVEDELKYMEMKLKFDLLNHKISNLQNIILPKTSNQKVKKFRTRNYNFGNIVQRNGRFCITDNNRENIKSQPRGMSSEIENLSDIADDIVDTFELEGMNQNNKNAIMHENNIRIQSKTFRSENEKEGVEANDIDVMDDLSDDENPESINEQNPPLKGKTVLRNKQMKKKILEKENIEVNENSNNEEKINNENIQKEEVKENDSKVEEQTEQVKQVNEEDKEEEKKTEIINENNPENKEEIVDINKVENKSKEEEKDNENHEEEKKEVEANEEEKKKEEEEEKKEEEEEVEEKKEEVEEEKKGDENGNKEETKDNAGVEKEEEKHEENESKDSVPDNLQSVEMNNSHQQLNSDEQDDLIINQIIQNSQLRDEQDKLKTQQNTQSPISQSTPSQTKKKIVTFNDPALIQIQYSQQDYVTQLDIVDIDNNHSKFKPKNMNRYLYLLASDTQPKPIILKSELNGKLRSHSSKKKGKPLILNSKDMIRKNIKMIQEISKRGSIWNIKCPKKAKRVPQKNCKKFVQNPQKFFTEDLCETVLKSYDLTSPRPEDKPRMVGRSHSPKKINLFNYQENSKHKRGRVTNEEEGNQSEEMQNFKKMVERVKIKTIDEENSEDNNSSINASSSKRKHSM